jgi:hypothetical protein
MKLLVFALILFCAVYFFGGARLRLFITLSGVAAILGLCFGPPEYVVFKDTREVISSDSGSTVVYKAWELNRLLPIEALADQVIYSPELDLSDPISDSHLAASVAPFAVPGGPAFRFLWIILIFGVVFSYKGVVFTYTTARNLAAARRLFAESARRDTVNAYEEFLKATTGGLFRPSKLRKKAQHARNQVYDKYVRRIQLLKAVNDRHVGSLTSKLSESGIEKDPMTKGVQETLIENAKSSSKLCGVIVNILKNNRNASTRELPYQIDLSPRVYLRGKQKGFDSIVELIEFRIEQDKIRWAKFLNGIPIAKMENLHPSLGIAINQTASEVRKTNNWTPFEELYTVCLSILDDQLANSPDFQVKRQALSGIFRRYLLNRITLQLPIKDGFSSYRQSYEKNIDTILAGTLSRFFPDELLDGDGLIHRSYGSSNKTLGSIEIDLLAEGAVSSSGTVSFSSRFRFQRGGSLVLQREGRLNYKRNVPCTDNQRPIIQAIDSAVTAFAPPSPPQLAQRTAPVSTDDDSIRKVFQEFDDLVNDFTKGVAEDVLLDYMVDNFSDELAQALGMLTDVISDQLRLQAESAVELAAQMAGAIGLGEGEE